MKKFRRIEDFEGCKIGAPRKVKAIGIYISKKNLGANLYRGWVVFTSAGGVNGNLLNRGGGSPDFLVM